MNRIIPIVLCVAIVAAAVFAYRQEAPATEARLIGRCDGRIMAAMQEDQFPAGCDWIEPIRYSEEDHNGATALRLGK